VEFNPTDYPFHSYFLSQAHVIEPTEKEYDVAIASIHSLASLLPSDLLPEENPDLLYFAANGAVAGVCNENDDCLDPDTAIEIYKSTKNKFLNVDHKRDIVVGSILRSGLSRYGSNELLTEEEARELPYFNLSVASVMWKAVNKKLAALLFEAGNEESDRFGSVSLSWEIFFKGYDIAIGSPILKEARIVTDPEEKEKLQKYLKANKGNGVYQGQKVYRVIRNTPEHKNVIIGGYSLVTNPAAQVNGIYAITSLRDIGDETSSSKNQLSVELRGELPEGKSLASFQLEDGSIIENVLVKKDGILSESITASLITKILNFKKVEENLEELNENVSQSEKLIVTPIIAKSLASKDDQPKQFTTKKITDMDIQKLEDIKSNWADFSQLDESIAYNKVSEIFKNGIKEASDKFEKDMKEKDSALASAIEKAEAAQAEAEANKAALAQVKEKLDAIEAEQSAIAAQEKYSARLSQLEDEYDLEDEDRQALASEIVGMDEEAYAAYKKKFDSLAKYKSKAYKKKMEEEVRAKCMKELESKASVATPTVTKTVEEIAQEALASTKQDEQFTPSGDTKAETSTLEKYQSAFASSKVSVKYRQNAKPVKLGQEKAE
jgi:hypothetical protein